jgi:hypothetical protein
LVVIGSFRGGFGVGCVGPAVVDISFVAKSQFVCRWWGVDGVISKFQQKQAIPGLAIHVKFNEIGTDDVE